MVYGFVKQGANLPLNHAADKLNLHALDLRSLQGKQASQCSHLWPTLSLSLTHICSESLPRADKQHTHKQPYELLAKFRQISVASNGNVSFR